MERAPIRVAINGLGRIGRAFVRAAWKERGIEVAAINDLGDIENLAYLLKYDTVYRAPEFSVRADQGSLILGNHKIAVLNQKDPTTLPWKDMKIDVAVESTGVFDSFEKARAHLTAGARRVVISAPAKDEDPQGATVLMGVNDELLKTCAVSSNASCTTNAGSPLIAILSEKLGIEKALLSTTHAYTATQSIVDAPAKGDFRRGRAAAQNISPSSTGAAVATTKAITHLSGKFDGIAIRVPVATGSLVDITFISSRPTSSEEVNEILSAAAGEERWQGIFTATKEPIVSSDIIGSTYASIADLSFTRVVDGNLVKVLAWYDNEMGYAHMLVRHVLATGRA